DLLDDDGLLQAPRILDGRGEEQRVALGRLREAFDHSQLVAVFAAPPGLILRDAGGFDDERLALPSSRRESEPGWWRIGRAFPAVQVHGAPRVPFAVVELDTIAAAPPDFELMRRDHLLRQTPGLTPQ